MRNSIRRVEFLLAMIIAILLVGSLLSTKYVPVPQSLISLLILAFISIKFYDVIKGGGTVFEDYVSIAIIILFGIIHLFLGDSINTIITTVIVFVLVYSVGLMPWIDDLLKSRRVTTFILSYAFFIFMIIFLFAGAFFANPSDFTIYGEKQTVSFEDALYFSTSTFTTVGYGDIAPIGINKFIASLEAITAIILNIAFIGYILASYRFREAKKTEALKKQK